MSNCKLYRNKTDSELFIHLKVIRFQCLNTYTCITISRNQEKVIFNIDSILCFIGENVNKIVRYVFHLIISSEAKFTNAHIA